MGSASRRKALMEDIELSRRLRAISPPVCLAARVVYVHGVRRDHIFSEEQAQALRDFLRTQAVLALMRDGFSRQSPGGVVALRGDGTPSLDYPLSDYRWDTARRALLSMDELQFAAGAQHVEPRYPPDTQWRGPAPTGSQQAKPSRSCPCALLRPAS